jgi:hypothetical protein
MGAGQWKAKHPIPPGIQVLTRFIGVLDLGIFGIQERLGLELYKLSATDRFKSSLDLRQALNSVLHRDSGLDYIQAKQVCRKGIRNIRKNWKRLDFIDGIHNCQYSLLAWGFRKLPM